MRHLVFSIGDPDEDHNVDNHPHTWSSRVQTPSSCGGLSVSEPRGEPPAGWGAKPCELACHRSGHTSCPKVRKIMACWGCC